ncbi:MAG: hypothetical protein JW779_08770, partial [Candidatus Thorarchaeota archaeon]|nr:hypothetical protein [Candidatus Thorarchaeota archaeon]
DTSMTGKMKIGTGDKFRRLLSGFGNIPLLLRVQKVAHLMEDIREVYAQYPTSPEGLSAWQSKLWPIYDAAKQI